MNCLGQQWLAVSDFRGWQILLSVIQLFGWHESLTQYEPLKSLKCLLPCRKASPSRRTTSAPSPRTR